MHPLLIASLAPRHDPDQWHVAVALPDIKNKPAGTADLNKPFTLFLEIVHALIDCERILSRLNPGQ
jgi:hypothetical protein